MQETSLRVTEREGKQAELSTQVYIPARFHDPHLPQLIQRSSFSIDKCASLAM